MKQMLDEKRCVSCVAAMATGTTIEEFENFIGSDPPYSDADLCKYLLHKNYVLGGQGFTNLQEVTLDEDTLLRTEWQMRNIPCYLVVESETQTEAPHAIYWDGEKVWDPNPRTQDGRILRSYKILIVFRITKIQE